MDGPDEALAYDTMDHSVVNRAFADAVLALFPAARALLDLGAGTARIPLELCRVLPAATVTATDLSPAMLALGAANVAAAGLTPRVALAIVDACELPWPAGAFDAVVSNSLVHHVPDTVRLFRSIARVSGGGGLLVRDLCRPADADAVEALVAQYTRGESASAQELFRASLHAALTVAEVRSMIAELGFDPAGVRATSDRHWTWQGIKS